MKLKLDENGAAILRDGKPVYEHDGKEIAFDAEQAFSKIGQLTGENTSYRKRFEEAEAKVKAYEGIDDPEAARKALETLSNIDQGKLVNAGKVEEIKLAAQKAAEEKVAGGLKAAKEELNAVNERARRLEQQLHEQVIGNGFANSKFIAEKIDVPVDMVRAAFGGAFKVEDGKTIAYGSDGKPIYSKQRMGELADFDEALEIMVDQYPNKDRILKASGTTGSGATDVHARGGAAQPKGNLGGSREERLAAIKARHPELNQT